jgi:tetratricopeptide (TPR) repeat protein
VIGNLARVAIQMKNFKEARDLSQKGLDINPEDQNCLNSLYWAYKLNGNNEKAEDISKKNLIKNPENLESLTGLGFSYYEKHEFGKAQSLFASILTWDASYQPALTGLKISVSANNWVTRRLVQRKFLIYLQIGIVLLSLVLFLSGGGWYNNSRSYLVVLLALMSSFGLPWVGLAFGRIQGVVLKSNLRSVFYKRELFYAIITIGIFVMNINFIVGEVIRVVNSSETDEELWFPGLFGLLLIIMVGKKIDVAINRKLATDVISMVLIITYACMPFVSLDVLILLSVLAAILLMFDMLINS